MSRFLYLTIIQVAVILMIKADFTPIPLPKPSSKIIIVDVALFDPFWTEAGRQIKSNEWFQRCFGPVDGINLNQDEKPKKSMFKTFKRMVSFLKGKSTYKYELLEVSTDVNLQLSSFMETYNKEDRSTTFTDFEYERLKYMFQVSASELKDLREKLDKENQENDDIKKFMREVYYHCEDIRMNLMAIKSVLLQQNFRLITMRRLSGKNRSNKPPKPTPKALNSFKMKKPQ
ncbi:uncharacterized protein LOC116349775 isoform X2 [Contarinia nasturtii]|uniref:uncharacterized protein LOC116349775 isoform X2 n=1 Tax=Contarinia nasturtii TaxID=265458 RepID=UPI0012D4A852|nr:uncharacterized protein LOC116349775 isoform X2 [Contarinia nasturtii]